MTAQEQAIEIAKRYMNGSDEEKEVILSCFTDEEKKTALEFFGYYKMFCDQEYYNTIKKAVSDQYMKEIYG